MSIYDYQQPENNGGLFLKFNNGDKVRMRLFGDPVAFMDQYKDQAAVQKFASLVLVANKETKKFDVKVFKFGWMIQKQLAAFKKDADWGDPCEYDIEVSATGDGTDREYQVVPKPKASLTKDQDAAIKDCQHDLTKLLKLDSRDKVTAPADTYDPFAEE